MIKIILVTFAIISTLSVFYLQDDEYKQFVNFKKTFNKVYNEEENQLRYRYFLENMNFINNHNKQTTTHKLALN